MPKYRKIKRGSQSYAVKIYCIILGALLVGVGIGIYLPPYNLSPTSDAQFCTDVAPPEQEQPQAVYYNIPLEDEFQDLVNNICERLDFNPQTIYGIMYVESRFEKKVTSDSIHLGLMQVNRTYFPHFASLAPEFQDLPESKQNIEDPAANIISGIYALDAWRTECMMRGYISESDWLEAYNNGFPYFKMPTKSTSYSSKVLKFAKELEVR